MLHVAYPSLGLFSYSFPLLVMWNDEAVLLHRFKQMSQARADIKLMCVPFLKTESNVYDHGIEHCM